jgi:hypothetical protein
MMYRIKKAVALVVAAAAAGLVYAQAPQWENLYPSYSGLAFGGGKFVAVSGDGLIKASSDGGASWSQIFVPDAGVNTRKIYAVAYGDGDGNGRFVAVQSDRKFLYSEKGDAEWFVFPTNINITCKYLAYGERGFVGIDGDDEYPGTILHDDEGWVQVVANFATDYLSHVAYGAGRYVAVGSNITSSADARGWGAVTGGSAPGGVGAVAFGDGKFVAVGSNGQNVYTSPNGTEWTSAPAGGGLSAGAADMTFGGGRFVAVGAGGKGAASSNGTSWTSFTLNEGDNFRAVKYGNNAYVALGANGSVYTSADGVSWSRASGSYAMANKQIVYGGSKFVAVGDSGASVSGNGRDWSKGNAGKRLQGVAYGAGRFVAVGDSGALYSSADGEAWAKHGDADGAMLSSVAFGDGKFLAGGKTYGVGASLIAVYASSDGQSWEELDPGSWSKSTQYPIYMCYGGDRFLAVVGSIFGGNSSREIKYSLGGANAGKFWSTALSENDNNHNIVSIAYASGKFVAVGAGATNAASKTAVLSSSDGANWETMALPDAIGGARSATFAKGFYVVAADSGNIYASANGAQWGLQHKATNRNLQTVYFGNDILLAAGAAGTMLYSAAAPSSINHNIASRKVPSQANGIMSISRAHRAPVVTLSFTPSKPGTIAIYSLAGKQLYKTRLSAGERSAQLPERLKMSSSNVIIRYTGDGKSISQRFQFIR